MVTQDRFFFKSFLCGLCILVSCQGAMRAKKNEVILPIFALVAPCRETIQTTVLYDVTRIVVQLLEKLSSSCDPALQVGWDCFAFMDGFD
jgi:hypothetical protein